LLRWKPLIIVHDIGHFLVEILGLKAFRIISAGRMRGEMRIPLDDLSMVLCG